MQLRDYFASKDGSGSVTKTFVTLAHAALFLAVVGLTIWHREFRMDMWTLYLSCTILHATYDKTMAVVTDLKKRQQGLVDSPTPNPSAAPPLEGG